MEEREENRFLDEPQNTRNKQKEDEATRIWRIARMVLLFDCYRPQVDVKNQKQGKDHMRRNLILIAVTAFVLVGLACIKLMVPFYTIRQLETRYQQVQPGMSTNEVQAIMNYDARWHADGVYWGWDDIFGPASTSPRRAVAYSVPTFYLPVTFEFVFDDSGKAMGKHRYD